MSLRPEFQKRLESQPDQELLDILAYHQREYVPEVIEAIRAELTRRGVDPGQAPLSPPPLPLPLDDIMPKLPKIWVGFLIAFVFLGVEILHWASGTAELRLLALAVAIGGWIYWLFCVSRFHDVANALAYPDSTSPSGTTYPVSATTAVARHFIPFYNFYWIFKWPMEMERYFKANTSVRMVHGAFLGLGLLSAVLLRMIDGFLGYCAVFGVGAYIAAKLRQVIRERREQKEKLAEVFA
jgi:hypothetical protein